jgi:CNT family concentrative nucleoside transporter
VKVEVPAQDVNLIDAAARGALDGIQLAINVGGMLIAFIALVAMLNGLLGFLHGSLESLAQKSVNSSFFGILAHYFPNNLQQILGVVFQPIAWTMGVSWKDSYQVGNLLGTRLVLNEVISFLQLGQIRDTLDPRSFMISTFALCGFANLGSIAIQVGGIGALAPSRRHDLAALGFKAMIAGTLANFLSATIAGLVS